MSDGNEKKVSIIIPCRNEGLKIKQTADFLLRTEAGSRDDTEIIVVDDGSEDRCCSFLEGNFPPYEKISLLGTKGLGAARARNLGAERAGGDILVFCDAHILVGKGWLDKLLEAFSQEEVDAVSPGIGPYDPSLTAGYGLTWDEKLEIRWLKKPSDLQKVPLAPGACLAIKKDVFKEVGGFDRGFNSWGYEDVELSLKLWLFGYQVFVNPQVRVGHYFRKSPPYAVNSVDFVYNRLRMAISHFNEARIAKVANLIKNKIDMSVLLTKVLFSDSMEQRKDYLARRKYDDEWFFTMFNIPF
ncbi:MAG: glycosyltransferase [Firmicutes bacterium]|nr:glycosyltransferase [Bacillota bacterium]